MMDSDEEVAREIEVDPRRPGPANVRLRESGVPVWAVIGYYFAIDEDAAAVARDYRITPEAVEAALRYYRLHRAEIDGRLADNRAVPTS